MNSFSNATVDAQALRKLYKSTDEARIVFDHFASRQRNWGKTTVDRLLRVLQREGHDIARRDIIDLFRQLEELGCGRFVVGRWGHSSRFEWTVEMMGVGRAATGEQDSIEAIGKDQPEDEEESEELITHTFVLRPDIEITLELPSDLTGSEAARLASFIQTLPFEPA